MYDLFYLYSTLLLCYPTSYLAQDGPDYMYMYCTYHHTGHATTQPSFLGVIGLSLLVTLKDSRLYCRSKTYLAVYVCVWIYSAGSVVFKLPTYVTYDIQISSCWRIFFSWLGIIEPSFFFSFLFCFFLFFSVFFLFSLGGL